jgi:arsenate reductase
MGCGDECPVLPGAERNDWPLPDPKGRTTEEVRKIRDDVRLRVEALVQSKQWTR